jgi:hypothetical protein
VFKRAEPLLRRLAPSSAERAVPVLTEVLTAGDPSKSRAANPSERSPEPSLRAPGLSLDDAGEFAERLRGRLNDYLRKDGRDLIEMRCRKMLDDHAAKIVEQIAGEVTLMLEIQIRQWVYEGIVEALERTGDTR